jgi:hypothetical protein
VRNALARIIRRARKRPQISLRFVFSNAMFVLLLAKELVFATVGE